MDKSLFPEGVVVGSTQLQNVETQVQFHVQKRFSDSTRPGRDTGLTISLGTPATRFDIAPGDAYTTRGDYVKSSGAVNIGLADYTLGVANLICLVYREVPGTPETYEDGGSVVNTTISGSSQIKVYTQAEYNALPTYASADFATNLATEDLTQDYQDTVVVLAVVYGKGYSSGSPISYVSGNLTDGTIIQQPAITAIMSATLPTQPSITGMNIKALSSNTRVGTGILMLSGSAGAYRLSWWSPDINGGWNGYAVSGLTPTGTGTFGNSSTVQTFTILTEPHSNANGYGVADTSSDTSTITVEVYTDLLAQTGYPLTDNVAVVQFYSDTAPVFSIQDILHRSKLGSYVPTAASPHGMGYPDFDQQVARIPQPMVLGENILANHQQVNESRLTIPRSTVGGITRTNMMNFSGGSYSIRVYKNSSDQFEIISNALWNDTTSLWTRDTSGTSMKLVIDSTGMYLCTYLLFSSTFGDSSWVTVWSSEGLNNTSPYLGLFNLASSWSGSMPRIKADYNAARTLLVESKNAGSGTDGTRIYSNNGGVLEIVNNASWNGTVWAKDNTSNPTSLYHFGPGTWYTLTKAAGSGTWNDSSWDDASNQNLYFDPTAGTISTTGHIGGGTSIGAATTLTSGTSTSVGTSLAVGTTVNVGTSITIADSVAAVTPSANTLYPDNIVKAWGNFTCTNASTCTLNSGFNFSTPTLATGLSTGTNNSGFTLPFVHNMSETFYATISSVTNSASFATGDTVRLYIQNSANTGPTVQFLDYVNNNVGTNSGSGSNFPVKFSVVILGLQ